MSLLKNFVPKEFKPFLNHIGPTAFKVVDWKSALKQSGKISKRYFSSEGKEALRAQLESKLPKGMAFADDTKDSFSVRDNSDFGEKVLSLYFAQLKQSKGTFLDLRLKTFSSRGDSILWSPSNLYIEWSEEFREGLIQVYAGFYENKPSTMDQGLLKMGLISDEMDDSTKDEVKELLIEHVGSESPESTTFALEKFEKSFEQFFQILKKNKMTLPADFLFLGVYLVTLYSTLEAVDCELNVKRAYLNS